MHALNSVIPQIDDPILEKSGILYLYNLNKGNYYITN